LIGVIVKNNEIKEVKEFFQLFKTSWEFYDDSRKYDAILTTKNIPWELNADFLIVYDSKKQQSDSRYEKSLSSQKNTIELMWNEITVPIYNDLAIFEGNENSVLRTKETQKTIGIKVDAGQRKIFRLGYDLFHEIRYLLKSGQPKKYSHIPTIDIHIAILRNFILDAGIPLLEIPPVPAGYDFVCCLTHDVDFVGIKNHRFDHTMFGFLYRALFVTFIDVFKKRASVRKLLKNWKSALLLPAVYANIVKDFWVQFDRYVEIEKNLPSTYFFIPFKKRAGKEASGKAPVRRECKYDISDVEFHVRKLISKGSEIGLHGIDAWIDSESGRKEFDQIQQATGNSNIGVRMHWLYFNNETPKHLEKAGFLYDSTCGYNEAVGFKAGTAQVFRPLDAERLLELPLQIQDTALFYPDRMGLDEDSAFELCKMFCKINAMYGGGLTLNWHHRSIAPERLWEEFYKRLLHHLLEYRVWFGTAEEVVRWFEKRRKAQFKEIKIQNRNLKVKICEHENFSGPDLTLRLHKPSTVSEEDRKNTVNDFIDIPIRDSDEIGIRF
jgi:hypothetical protein